MRYHTSTHSHTKIIVYVWCAWCWCVLYDIIRFPFESKTIFGELKSSLANVIYQQIKSSKIKATEENSEEIFAEHSFLFKPSFRLEMFSYWRFFSILLFISVKMFYFLCFFITTAEQSAVCENRMCVRPYG